MKRVAFLVNGSAESAMAIRARSFAQELPDFKIQIFFRRQNRFRAIFQFLRELVRLAPEVIYVFDMSFSGVTAALVYRSVRTCRVIIDTGDAISYLAESMGQRNWAAQKLTQLLEYSSIRFSDALVVRSNYHREVLCRRKEQIWVIPDGVDIEIFRPMDVSALREALGLKGFFTLGLVGSLTWNPKWQVCYGWELLEALSFLRDLPIMGVLVGDGTGLTQLEELAQKNGVRERVLFLGRVPYEELPKILNCMDVCLSTQSNDLAGQVRTTGKLPLYLASGRHVISTAVGEAMRILPAEMLMPYEGVRDRTYPERLAKKVRTLFQQQRQTATDGRGRTIARNMFDYRMLAKIVRDSIEGGPC